MTTCRENRRGFATTADPGRIAAAIIFLTTLAACGGGSGGGGVSTIEIPELTPDAQSIQDDLFTPHCATSGCHDSSAPPEGLDLTNGTSFGLLVDVPSEQAPALDRVEPGDPDNSYLIVKLEQRGLVGNRMPADGPPFLDRSAIDVVRQWINDGAMTMAVVLNAWVQPFSVLTVSPATDAVLADGPEHVVLSFSNALDHTRLDARHFALQASGGDGTFNDGNEVNVPFSLDPPSTANPATVVLDLATDELADDRYRIAIDEYEGTAPQDLSGQRLAGGFTSTFIVR